MLEYTDYIKMLVGLIAIVNPIGAIPLFISFTASLTPKETKTITNVSSYSVFIILMVSLLVGELILTFFGVTISSFRVAGGLLILLMAISMMHATTSKIKQTDEELEESDKKNSIAVVPLAIPLLAGPGAISTTIIYAHQGTGIGHILLVSGIIAITAAFVFLSFKMVPFISKHISRTGINICIRLMGILLATLAIEIITTGLKGIFPMLARL